jgi:hypothetical protein
VIQEEAKVQTLWFFFRRLIGQTLPSAPRSVHAIRPVMYRGTINKTVGRD